MHRRGLYDPIEKEPVLRLANTWRNSGKKAESVDAFLYRSFCLCEYENSTLESETLDTSLQNPFHICDRDPVICHRNLLVGGTP